MTAVHGWMLWAPQRAPHALTQPNTEPTDATSECSDAVQRSQGPLTTLDELAYGIRPGRMSLVLSDEFV